MRIGLFLAKVRSVQPNAIACANDSPEYEQALEFDQLRKIMDTGEAFAGFNEAPIHFPPTFKYDVLRTIKRSRHKSFKRTPPTPTILTPSHDKMLSEVQELEPPAASTFAEQQDNISQHEQNGVDDVEPDAASVVSSAWMSVRSRRTVDPDPDEEPYEGEPISPKYSGQSPPASASTSNLVQKVWTATAAHKAKDKWMGIFKPDSPRTPQRSSPSKRSKWRQSWSSKHSSTPTRRASQPSVEEFPPHTPMDPADPRQPKAGRRKELQAALLDAVHSRSHQHLALSENNVDLEEEDKGVYDSSHKQRVPSWSVPSMIIAMGHTD